MRPGAEKVHEKSVRLESDFFLLHFLLLNTFYRIYFHVFTFILQKGNQKLVILNYF